MKIWCRKNRIDTSRQPIVVTLEPLSPAAYRQKGRNGERFYGIPEEDISRTETVSPHGSTDHPRSRDSLCTKVSMNEPELRCTFTKRTWNCDQACEIRTAKDPVSIRLLVETGTPRPHEYNIGTDEMFLQSFPCLDPNLLSMIFKWVSNERARFLHSLETIHG